MIIVSGRIVVRPGKRDSFLAMSLQAMEMARRTPGCSDFIVAADPIDPDRVNVYEEWDSETALLAFRGDGPGAAMTSVIVSADIRRHLVTATSSP